jgi:protein-S-isoprenylcysteine O-methyltransferase Ste14
VWPTARLIIFVVASAGLAYLSRRSLLRPRTHGFFRFFVFESILALTLINLPVWFSDPLSVHQLISWILLLACLIPLGLGIRDMRRYGQADASRRQDPELLGFERTTRVVRMGVFSYIRHPLYTSLLLLAWGVFFKAPAAIGAVLAAIATAGVVVMSRLDEVECLRVFGEEYREYMLHTKRFVPRVI